MPVEVTCPSCAKHMRVPDNAAGKRIKCPKCQAIIGVPDPTASAVPQGVAVELWHLKTDDGQVYGPIVRADLDQWQAEGRLNNDSQILRHGGDQWQWASDLYPQLAAAPGGAVPMGVAASPYHAEASASSAPAGSKGPFDFTGGAAASAAPANPFDFSVKSSANRKSTTSSGLSTAISDKSKIAAGLLGIFLGAYGIHNFYLGFTNKAVTQLIVTFCTCGLGGIWGFIEGIQILMGSINRDARGRRLKD